MIVRVLGANDDLFTPFNYFAYPVLAAILSAVLQRILNLVCTLLDPGFSVSAITFEYLKAEILNISKPYLQNIPAYDYLRAAFIGKRSDL